jgi:hypothetical protein
MTEKHLYAAIVKSGTWLYDNQVPHEVWIVRQNFDYYYEEGYEDDPEQLNQDGELFHIVFAFNEIVRTVVPAKLSLADAISDAEERLVAHQLDWTNHRLQKVFPPYYSLSEDTSGPGAVLSFSKQTSTDDRSVY